MAYAREHGVRIVVGSSFHAGPGTTVADAAGARPGAPHARSHAGEVLRPLVLQIDENCGRLRAAWSTAAAARGILARLARAETQALVAQWVDAGPDGFWEGWGETVVLDRVQAALAATADDGLDAAAALDRADGFACLSLAGARPRSWPGVLASLRAWLEARGLDDCARAQRRRDGQSAGSRRHAARPGAGPSRLASASLNSARR